MKHKKKSLFFKTKTKFFLVFVCEMEHPRVFAYTLANAPAFVCEPAPELKLEFQTDFHNIALDCFAYLRKHADVSPNALVSSLGGGMTLAEFCILWIRIRSEKLKQNWNTFDAKKRQHNKKTTQ